MTILQRMVQGARASVTLDNINLSQDYATTGLNVGRGAMPLVGGKVATYGKMYESQLWVWVVVNKLSRGIGRLPLKTYQFGEGDERERVRSGRLPDLLAHPFERGNPFLLKSAVVGNVAVYGNAVAVKIRPATGQPPTELLPSSWAYWTVVPGSQQPIDWYVFNKADGRRIPFRPEEIVHWRWWSTGRDIVGPPPLEPLRQTLQIEDAAQRTTISSYEHGARPVGAYSVESQLKEATAQRLRDQLNERYGGVDNAYKIMLMEGGAKWVPMSHNLVDSAIIDTRKLTREEVAAAYDIPPPIVGILDRATFSNITEQHRMLYMDTMGPWLTMFEETLQAQLIDEEPMMEGQFVEFDLNEVLKGDIKARYDALSKAVGGPWMLPDEARSTENLHVLDTPDSTSLHTPLNTRSEEDDESGRAEATIVPEARCPGCNRILAKNVVRADLECPDSRCKRSLRIGI